MRAYGWRKDRLGAHPVCALPPEGLKFPDTFSLRSGFPEVYDQGPSMSCTGNGTAGVLHFDRREAGKEEWTPSRKFPYYNGRKREGSEGVDNGAMICDVVDSLLDVGYCREELCPFADMDRAPSEEAYREGLENLVPGRAKLVQNAVAFKHALMQRRPIIFGMMVYTAFETDAVAKSGVLHVPVPGHESFMGGHCVDLIGWKPKFWEVRNSWGSRWGNEGNFWIQEEYLLRPDLSSDFTIIPRVK